MCPLEFWKKWQNHLPGWAKISWKKLLKNYWKKITEKITDYWKITEKKLLKKLLITEKLLITKITEKITGKKTEKN